MFMIVDQQNIHLIITSCLLVIILWISKIVFLNYFQKFHNYFELGILISNMWLYWYFIDTQTFSYIYIALSVQQYFCKLFDLDKFFAFIIICSLCQQFNRDGFINSIYLMPFILTSHLLLLLMAHFKFGFKQKKDSIQDAVQSNIMKTLSDKYNWLELEQATIINSQFQVEFQYQQSPYFQSSHKQYEQLESLVSDSNKKDKSIKDHINLMAEQIKNEQEVYKFNVFNNQKYNLYIILDDSFDQIYFIIFRRQIDEKSQEVLLQVCQSISHELSTSLNSIIILSNLQMESDTLTEDQKQQIVEPVLLNAQQLQLITNNLKDYPNLLANDIQIYISRFDIVEEILEIIEYFSFSIQSKGLKLKLDFDIADTYIEADKSRIKQIFYQLMSNAVRFTLAGIITIKINRENKHLVIISVEDQGIGMSQEETQRLEELLNGPTPLKISSNSVGCGLGLFISNLISKKINQKSLEFSTQYSKGSKFTLYVSNQKQTVTVSSSVLKFYSSNTYIDNLFNISISLKSATIKTVSIKERSQKVSNRIKQSIIQFSKVHTFKRFSFEEDDKSQFLNISDEESLDLQPPQFSAQYRINYMNDNKNECCRKILIVDDEYFNIFALQKVMKTLGFSSDHAYNGKEALHKINNKPKCDICDSKFYTLIFLDINMPILDGLQTVIIIKRMIKDNKINQAYCIANSAYGDIKTKQKAFDSDDYQIFIYFCIIKFQHLAIISLIFDQGIAN
ncbi:hypothetical protein pb186bvf_010986 [Paramecium bursaria]